MAPSFWSRVFGPFLIGFVVDTAPRLCSRVCDLACIVEWVEVRDRGGVGREPTNHKVQG